jgi:tetratricopeptide (TPR) repeat protein
MVRLFLSIDRKEDALFFADEALEIIPNNISILLNKGIILEKLDKLEKSNKCYDKVLRIDKNNKFALNNKSMNLKREGALDKALIFVNQALEGDEEFIIAISNKVDILIGLNRSEEALQFLEPVLLKHNDSRILALSKINVLIELLDLKEAMKLNDLILKEEPMDIDAINNKGVIYEHNSKYQNREKYLGLALEWFEKAINRDKKYPFGWANKIVCLINNNSISVAESVLESVLDQFPDDPYLLREKGRICLIKGEPKKALKYINKSIKKNSMKQTMIGKCRALYSLNKHKQVIDLTEIILNIDNKFSEAWHLKSLALRKTHQMTKADYCLKKAEESVIVPKSLLE